MTNLTKSQNMLRDKSIKDAKEIQKDFRIDMISAMQPHDVVQNTKSDVAPKKY